MKYIETELQGVWVIEPQVFGDSRGYFFESWIEREFETHVGPVCFVQDNESKSQRDVLRGLHYQQGAASQAKLVRVISGRVYDVVVDLRQSSRTFCRHFGIELSGENKRQLFVPRGFAHGFMVLSDEAIFSYKVDNYYAPQSEASIRWNDPDLGISWPKPAGSLLLSQKDLDAKSFKEAQLFD